MPDVSFDGEGKAKVQAIVNWVDKKLSTPTHSYLDAARLGKRTPVQILSSGKANFAFGCLDRAAVMASMLKQNGFDAYLICERILHKGDALGLHFSVQVADGRRKFTVDPQILRTTVINKWRNKKRNGFFTYSFEGLKRVSYELVIKKEVSAGAMHRSAFNIVGLRGTSHYIKLARLKPLKALRFVASHSGKKAGEQIKAAKRKSMRPK